MKELELYFGPQHLGMVGNFSITLKVEGDRILKAYGNHPSFCMPKAMACVNLITKTIYLSNHPGIANSIEQALTHEHVHLVLYELCDLDTSKQFDNISSCISY